MDKLSELLKSVRPATKEELREQGENLAKNYKPGPRQAVPFLPAMEARVEQELPALDVTQEEIERASVIVAVQSCPAQRTAERSTQACLCRERQLRTTLAQIATLRADGTKVAEELATRNKWMHSRFGFVPKEGAPNKCACAYCTRDVEALADHAAEMEMQLFLEGGWKDRAEKAESELARERERHQELRQVVKEYRQKHRIRYGCDMEVAADKTKCDDRCSICKQADALLVPKAEPAPVATGEK